jgi:hypothetical protein
VQAAIGLAAIAFLLFWLQFSRADICCGDFDGYYHIHWSQLLWEGIRHGHFPPAFSWLPLTSLNAHDYSDQHLLFHLLLIPFLWFANPVSAAKVSAALFGTMAMFSCFWLMLRYRVGYATLWLIAMLGSSSLFLCRMSMTRAQSVSVLFVMAGIFLLLEEKYRWLAPLAFFYVWTYNLFVILGAMALLWMAAVWWTTGRREWRPVLWTGIGTAAGLLLNPYFPNNLRLFREHLTAKAGAISLQPGTGTEWYALPSWDLLTSGLVAFAAMLAGYIAFGFLLGRRGRQELQRPAFFLLFASLLLLLTARSGRFNEYWPPCAVLFAAFTLQEAGEPASPGDLPHSGSKWKRKNLQAVAVALALAGVLVYQVRQARHWIAAPANSAAYRGGTQWLIDHAPRGAIIFNASWDDFPKLFYYNDANAYVSGLDPIYLSDHNPELGRLYERIVSGRERHPGEYIRQKFGAEYVFVTAAADRNFYVAAMLSGQFTKVYEDQECIVLKVRDSDSTDSE